jgi:uncharacterized phage infection (PIP) family protein YhgE
MSSRTKIFYLALCSIGFSSCEQRDDQALVKVYEVFQRDMQARDETQRAAMEQVQGQLRAVTEDLETLKKGISDSTSPESSEKLASQIAEAVSKKVAEQSAAALAEMKTQMEALKAASPPALAGGQSASPNSTRPNTIPGPDGTNYRDRPPAPAPPPTSTTPKDPSRKTYKIDF